MALTGLALFGFTIGHLAGNLLIFKGAESFNAYAEGLAGFGVLLYAAEVGLIIFFVIHAYSGIRVTLENRRARKSQYMSKSTAGEATLASRTMAIGGVILAIFIVLHVRMFKYGDHQGEGGLWGLVIRTFQDPLMVAWYTLAMVALGLHLSHGIGSAFQTLGALKSDWRRPAKKIGMGLGWVIALGFASLPIWSYIYR
jgi:succinate dehydrogenase / fumarate reductase cytochrome b subunit